MVVVFFMPNWRYETRFFLFMTLASRRLLFNVADILNFTTELVEVVRLIRMCTAVGTAMHLDLI